MQSINMNKSYAGSFNQTVVAPKQENTTDNRISQPVQETENGTNDTLVKAGAAIAAAAIAAIAIGAAVKKHKAPKVDNTTITKTAENVVDEAAKTVKDKDKDKIDPKFLIQKKSNLTPEQRFFIETYGLPKYNKTDSVKVAKNVETKDFVNKTDENIIKPLGEAKKIINEEYTLNNDVQNFVDKYIPEAKLNLNFNNNKFSRFEKYQDLQKQIDVVCSKIKENLSKLAGKIF